MTEYGVHTARSAGARRSTLARRAALGQYERFHAGVYIEAAKAGDPITRILAAAVAYPNAVLLGVAALHVTAGWRDVPLGAIELASPGTRARTHNLVVFDRRVPDEWAVSLEGVRLCRPPFAVADLAGTDDGVAIDRFLREGGRLADVEAAEATMVRWPNSARRRDVIKASRTLPWSAAERVLHRILLDAGITGWVSNLRVVIGGRVYFLDVAFAAAHVALEVDGFDSHSSRAAFITDRERQNALVLAGWTVLRFSWAQLQDPTRVATEVRAAISRSTGRRSGRKRKNLG